MRRTDQLTTKLPADQALSQFMDFVEDPLLGDEEEALELLQGAGFNFDAFNARLSTTIEQATKKARLNEARVSREGFVARTKRSVSSLAISLEEKKAEIEQRLGMIGGLAAARYHRNFQETNDETEIDDLLQTLRELDERIEDA